MKSTMLRPLLTLIASMACSYFSFSYGSKFSPEWGQVLIASVAIPISGVMAIRSSYLLYRALHYQQVRRKAEEAAISDLRIPADVKRVEDFPPLDHVDYAQHSALPEAVDAQGKFRSRAITILCLAPLITILASLEATVWKDTPFGSGLALGEVLLVFVGLIWIIVAQSPSAAWVIRRTRAALLRREQYLGLAYIGPYHDQDANQVEVTATTRIERLRGLTEEEANDAIRSESTDGQTWLEKASVDTGSFSSIGDLKERVECFHHYRIRRQIAWMDTSVSDLDQSSNRLLILTLGASAFTAAIAFMRFQDIHLLLTNATTTASTVQSISQAFQVAGLFLPALTGVTLALDSVLNLRHLSKSYQMAKLDLRRCERESATLSSELKSTTAPSLGQSELAFKRIAAKTEECLTQELIRWRIAVSRSLLS